MRFWAALILVLTSPSVIQAAPPEMKTIDDFIIDNANATNGGTEVFIGLRCSSLYALLSRYTADNNMADAAKVFKDRSGSALEIAMKIQKPYNDEYTKGQLELMGEAYTERFLKAKARTGNFGDDEVIRSDWKTCDELF
ncbi:MAG: hypothetical protein HQ482_08755 [Sphingomonadales bacterium]|nr:hypothetical protein [Sphingomonadales bacterium]